MEKDHKYLYLLKDVKFDPVFITGINRSGTSILYKTLAESGVFNYITIYHIICYEELLHNFIQKSDNRARQKVNELLKKLDLKDRGFDNFTLSADTVEEYSITLITKSFFPHLNNKNLPALIKLAKKVQFISGNRKPILLKNPYEIFNFLYIKKIFPRAKFIFIHRNPLYTLNSQLNIMRELFKQDNCYMKMMFKHYATMLKSSLLKGFMNYIINKHSRIGLTILALYLLIVNWIYLIKIKRLPGDCYVEMTYEELCCDRDKTIRKIMALFRLDESAPHNIKTNINPRNVSLDPQIKQIEKSVRNLLKAYYRKFNFFDHHKPGENRKTYRNKEWR